MKFDLSGQEDTINIVCSTCRETLEGEIIIQNKQVYCCNDCAVTGEL